MEKTTRKTRSPDLKRREWYAVYLPRDPYHVFRFLKQGFRHVELTAPIRYDENPDHVVWLNLLPSLETLDIDISTDPRPPWDKCPEAVVQHVTVVRPYGKMRSWFDIGPPSCVEVAKMALGINAFFVRTPWQLFKYIRARNGIIGAYG